MVHFNAPVYKGSSIPGIVDLKQVEGFEQVRVELGPLNENQIELFIAIETPDWDSPMPTPTVPFENFQHRFDPLPMFGTIGKMYECIKEYMALTYTDGQTLWEKVYDPYAVQVDLFNFESAADYHPDKEYPLFEVKFPLCLSPSESLTIAYSMIDAIVDQGEGSAISQGAVEPEFVPSEPAVAADYGSDSGEVRYRWDKVDHFDRFKRVKDLMASGKITTWPEWLKDNKWNWKDHVSKINSN